MPVQPIKWLRVIRDLAIVWGVALAGTLFFISAKMDMPASQAATFWGTIGFFVVGFLTKENRLQHIALVGGLFWITSFIDVFFGATVAECLAGLFTKALMAAFGGGLSSFFVKRKAS